MLSSLTVDLDKTGVRMGMGFSIVSVAALTGSPMAGALIRAKDGVYLNAHIRGGIALITGGFLFLAARLVKIGFVLKAKM